MRQLLDDNGALVGLLCADIINHDASGTEPNSSAETESRMQSSQPVAVLELLEIMSATCAPGSGEEDSGL